MVGDKPSVASSKISKFGFVIKALPITNICCSPPIRSEIWKVITILKNKGVSILIIDKSLKQLQDLADKFYILEKGKTVWDGFSKSLTSKIAQRYLGV